MSNDGPSKTAPLIIFGGIIIMSILCLGIVIVGHSQRTEPYLDAKMRQVRVVKRQVAGMPKAEAAEVFVLNYAAFGPNAEPLLGNPFWQWQETAGSGTGFDIKIVVYRGSKPSGITTRFPVDPKKMMDHRYIQYTAALSFLDARMSQGETEPSLRTTLQTTRDTLVKHFSETAGQPL